MDIADVQCLLAWFYADDGLIAAHDPALLQLAFDSLCSHVYRVELKTNTSKMEAIVFLSSCIRTCLIVDTYGARMGGLYCKERHWWTAR